MKHAGQLVMMAGLAMLLAGRAECSPQSFEIDLKELDAGRKSGAVPRRKAQPMAAKVRTTSHEPVASAEEAGEFLLYTVKPGDHIFKILMRDFHLSNAAAERLIPEIARRNNLTDIRRLTVGKTLRIPKSPATVGQSAGGKRSAAKAEVPVAEFARVEAVAATAVHEEVVAAAPQNETVTAPVAPPPPVAEQVVSVAKQPTDQQAATPMPPAMAPVGSVMAVTINGGDPLSVFLRVADVLQLQVQSHRVIESRAGTAESFSIKVPLYAESQGKRLIVAGGGQDPFQYTLFRLLEAEGYGVLQFRETDGFREVTAATLAKLGINCRLARYRLLNGKEQEVLGYLITTPGGKTLLTDAPVGGLWSALEIGGE